LVLVSKRGSRDSMAQRCDMTACSAAKSWRFRRIILLFLSQKALKAQHVEYKQVSEIVTTIPALEV
jgi:hypothetical protein